MIIILLFFLAVNHGCFAADEHNTKFVEATASYFTTNRSIMSDPIATWKGKTNEDKASLYLRVARKILCDLLEKNVIAQPNHLPEYRYDTSIVRSHHEPISHAKIQIFPSDNYSFSWHTKTTPTNSFLCYNSKAYHFAFLDAVISPDGKFILTINSVGQIGIGTTSHGSTEKLSQQYLAQDFQEKHKNKERITLTTAFITCSNSTNDYCYCAVDTYIFQFKYNIKGEIVEKEQVFKGESHLIINRLLVIDGLLMVEYYDQQQKTRNRFFLNRNRTKTNTDLFIAEMPKNKETFTISLKEKDHQVLFDKGTKNNNVSTISHHDIATLRKVNVLTSYIAMDLNVQENRIAMLNALPATPILQYTEFIPQTLKPMIEKFNKQVMDVPNKDAAHNLVKELLNAYYPQTRKQWLYETVMGNLKWFGAATVGLLTLTWLYSKGKPSSLNRVTSPSNIQQPTPKLSGLNTRR